MAGHAQLNFVVRECSKTQIRLTGLSLMQTPKNFRKIVFTSFHFNSLSVSYALTALIFNYVESFIHNAVCILVNSKKNFFSWNSLHNVMLI